MNSTFAARLSERGLDVTPQRAIGPYNLDIAVNAPLIAVEIYGGKWHSTGTHRIRHFERCKYLLDLGWNVVIVWVDGLRYPLDIGADNYIVAFVEQLRRAPTVRGQYRVILGNGRTCARL